MDLRETQAPQRSPAPARALGPAWRVPAVAGATAFWLANLVISLTPVAAGYRRALSITYLPMLAEAAVGGLVISTLVAWLLARFPDRVPGRGAVAQALVLAAGSLALLTVTVALPSVVRSTVADPGHWLLVGTAIDAVRIFALGLTIGLVSSARTRGEHHQRLTREGAP